MRTRLQQLVLVGSLFAGAAAHADDWTSFGPDGRLSSERSGPRFEAGWRHDTPAERQEIYRAMLASPVAADGVVVVGNYGDRVRALSETGGQLLWDATVLGPHHASPAAWRGWLFVPSVDLTLRALRLADGGEVWKRDLPGMGFSSPVVVDDKLFVATANPAPRLLCLEAETGTTIWQTGAEQLQQGAYAAVVVAGERVLVAESRGRLHSFARNDGHWQWTAVAPGMVNVSSPVVLGGRVYLLPGGDSARLHAFEIDSGLPASGFPVDLAPPAVTPDAGTLMGSGHVLSSLAGTTGLLVFSWRVDERFDNNADATPDRFVSRELVVGLNPLTGATLWTAPAGRLDTSDGNRVPLHGLIATPALFRAADATLVAASSSLEARVRVYAGATGNESWSAALAGPTRSSPVFANGRLVVATDAGTVESFGSTTNRPPIAPVLGFVPADGTEVDASAVTIKWGTAVDPEMGALEYEVRLDDDGELLHDWQVGKRTSAGELALGRLAAGNYSYAVRARDAEGAWSAWSGVNFQVFAAPEVSVDGQPAASLTAAVVGAQPGAVITLGAGTVVLDKPLDVPAGITLRGAGPHLTVILGRGLDAAIKPGAGARLEQLTVARAEVGVAVAALDVRLINVILRDNRRAGLEVTAAGSATLINGTATRNGTGVRALGPTGVRNTLLTGNAVGLFASTPTTLTSRYNDVFGNPTADYEGRTADATDLSAAVTFVGDTDHLRLAPAQPSTDRGDPADEFGLEPTPNGGRINIGAFGNTVFAELSLVSLPGEPDAGAGSDADVPGSDAGSPSNDAGPGSPRSDASQSLPGPGGCGCDVGGASPGPGGALVLLMVGLLAWRRRR